MNATFLGLPELGSEGAAGVVIDAAIKGAVVLVLAAVVAWCLRRASASKRHLVWALASSALAVLPTLSLAPPRWRVTVFPAPAMQSQTSVFVSPGEAVSDAPADALEVSPPAFVCERPSPNNSAVAPPVTEVATDFRFDGSQMLLAIWCLGAGAAFLPWTIGPIRTRWLASRSAEFRGGAWPTLVQQGRDQLGMGREVRVLQTPHESTAHLAPHQTHRSISDEFDLRFMKPTMVACRGSPSPYGRKMNP